MDTVIISISKNNLFEKIRSKYILKLIFDSIKINKSLEIMKYNKNIQERLEIGIDDYKDEYFKIEIEIFPKKYRGKYFIKFINISNLENKSNYHIYFNDNNIEIKSIYFTGNDHVSKIKIILDKEFTSFNELFKECTTIEKINFIKFNRTDITNMNFMFYRCLNLKKINLNKFKTNNVVNMYSMFSRC